MGNFLSGRIDDDVMRRHKGQKFAFFLLGQFHFFGHGSDVYKALTENDENPFCSASKCTCRAIKGRVSCAKDNNSSVQLGQLRLASAHAGFAGLCHFWQKAFGSVKSLAFGQALENGYDLGLGIAKT